MKIVRARRAARRRRVRAPRRARPGARRLRGGQPGEATCRSADIYSEYVDRVLSFVDVSAIAPLRIVVDAANGMAGAMLPPVLERLPVETVRCYFEPDGTLPEPRAEPAAAGEPRVHRREDARGGRGLRRGVRRRRRPLLLRRRRGRVRPRATSRPRSWPRPCSSGSRARGSSTTSARAGPSRRRSRPRGGVPLVNRVGHAFIKHRMRAEDAAFGGEVSGHYYFRDFCQADSGVVPFLLMLELVSKKGRKLSRDPAAVPRALLHHRRAEHAGRRTWSCKLRELEERFGPEGTVSHLDGVSVDARRLALQRAAVEHRAAAPSEPRGALAGADGAQARRGARRYPRLSRTASATRSTEARGRRLREA